MAAKNWNAPNPLLFENFKGLKITVTGGAGFVGCHLVDDLLKLGARKEDIYIPRTRECDLRKPEHAALAVKGKDVVFHLAARVGGIGLNEKCPAELIYDNGMMGLNVVHEAHKAGVKKVIVAGTVCAYPKFTPTPFKEDYLWDGYPEETNAPYGVAKKMVLVALQSYRQQHGLRGIYLLPANLYGPHDNFDLESSHVIPAMIRKFVEAKKKELPTVELWGDGTPTREFLFVKDCARGLVEAALKYDGHEPVNLGTSEETRISDLAETVKDLVGYRGEIKWNQTRANGQPKRQLDTTRAREAFGYEAQTKLKDGLKETIHWFLENYK
jgi:GDP-L-fucose synthase